MKHPEEMAAEYEYRWEKAMDELHGASDYIGQLNEELNEVHNKLGEAENTIHLLRQLVEDYLPQIGMTIHFREMFYQIVGKPYPDWFEVPESRFYERAWIKNHSLRQKASEKK